MSSKKVRVTWFADPHPVHLHCFKQYTYIYQVIPEILAMVLVWRIGEFADKSPNLKSPNIVLLHYAYAIIIGHRSSPN